MWYFCGLHDSIDDFGASAAIAEISVQGCILDLTLSLWKSRKCASRFVDSFASDNLCYFPHFQVFRQLMNKKIAPGHKVGKRYLISNIMVKPLQFSDSSGSNTTGWITVFYRGLTRICTPAQYGYINPEIVYYYFNASSPKVAETMPGN